MEIQDLVGKLQDRIANDGSVDQIMMLEQTNIIERVASFTIGMLSLLIMIFVPIIVSLEIIYICFPICRDATEKIIVKIESRGKKGTAIGFILRDALEAVKQANTTMIGEKSALWIYLGIKCKSLMFLMFIIVFIIRGSGPIVGLVHKLFINVIETIF